MWTDDDRANPSRWQRLRRSVEALDESALLRWVLMVNVSLVSLWIVLSLVVTVAQGVASLLGWR